MNLVYKIPMKRHQTENLIHNSRFVTIADRATSVAEARQIISEIKSSFSSANHHVYAFRIGFGNSVIEGMSDDGEPSGTSGPPTLSVLRGSDIGDIVLVTTRYFGGKKLGKGGLVRAYTESAQLVLSSLDTELKIPKRILSFEVPYHLYEIVKLLIAEYDGHVQDETFAGEVIISVQFVESVIEEFVKALSEKSSGQITPIVTESVD